MKSPRSIEVIDDLTLAAIRRVEAKNRGRVIDHILDSIWTPTVCAAAAILILVFWS